MSKSKTNKKAAATKASQPKILMTSEPLEFGDAVIDIAQIIKHPVLKNIACQAIGGSIEKDRFFTATTNTDIGVLMWFCINKDPLTEYPPFFLASEPFRNSQDVNTITDPRQSILATPRETFIYNGPPTEDGVRAYLRQAPVFSPAPMLTGTIGRGTTRDLKDNFDDVMERNLNSTGGRYNEKNWAFFQNNDQYLNRLVSDRTVAYIHYFFGYVEGPQRKNAIRVILMGADRNHVNKTDIIIQRSIPPAMFL